MLAGLNDSRFPGLIRLEAGVAAPEDLMPVHEQIYVQKALGLRTEAGKLIMLDADTVFSCGTLKAALRGAGGAIDAVDVVMSGQASSAFVATRPPGHHAEPSRAMGFCLFNNVAIAAHHARARWGLKRIAVADFDVHHGNGTQAAFWDDPDLFFVSSHQHPCYPGTGFAEERGSADNIVNAPLAPGTGSVEFRSAWSNILIPALDVFAPELLIVSAGFDAHRDDPLAQLQLGPEDFSWVTKELVGVALRHCRGQIVSVLEGGYDLPALAESAAAHVSELQTGDPSGVAGPL